MSGKWKYGAGLLIIVTLFLVADQVQAQGKKRVIQLSGVILGEDSISVVPGVHIYVPKAGRGTTSNIYGYFSMPTLVGDSVVISAVGFEKQHYIVPDARNDNVTLIVEMVSDTTYLDPVEIVPFPTEEIFKEAVLALNVPIDAGKYQNDNLSAELLAAMVENAPMDGALNHRWFMENMYNYQNSRYGPPSNPFLNPFNWARFIKDLKRKKKK